MVIFGLMMVLNIWPSGFHFLDLSVLGLRPCLIGHVPIISFAEEQKFTLQKIIPGRLVEVDIVKYWGWGPNLSDLNILIEDRAKVWNLKDLQAETQSVGVWGGDGDNNILQMIFLFWQIFKI